MTILTGGLFLVIWVLADLCGALSPYRCQACGRASRRGLKFALLVIACAVLTIIVACVVAAIWMSGDLR